MSPEQWKQVKGLFNEAAELSHEERKIFLRSIDAELRPQIEKMLEAAATEEQVLDAPVIELGEIWQEEEIVGQKVGEYKILREIGTGGMGSVYEAIRDDGEFEQRVAIKLIKSGIGSKEISGRFRQERQILASLEHPHIARLLGGGVTEKGLPYYAMEFIDGKPIDEYCREHQLGITERLHLFRQVCSAVSYAHSRLVVHRDLKPGNIFVSHDGTVKLLDFGISKVMAPDAGELGTATQMGIMTPAYASPEQVRGETVTTSTDVYSLGVILYELLTDRLPYQTKGKSIAELLRIVSEARITKPSDIRQDTPAFSKTKGDLDIITLKALNKEIERRYASVEQFSEDIRRFLNDLPVSAQPDSVVYRYKKFLQRNLGPVAAAAAVFVALVFGIVATLYQSLAARQQQAIAEKRFDQVRKLANNVVFKYHDAIAKLPGSTETREMLVKDATEYLDNLALDAGDNPELQIELAQAYTKIGNVQGAAYLANLGATDQAAASYQKSISIYESLLKTDPENVAYLTGLAESVEQKCLVLIRLGRWTDAEKLGERNLEINMRIAEKTQDALEAKTKLIRSYHILGDAVNFQRGHLASIDLYKKAVSEAEAALAKTPNHEMMLRNLIVPLQRMGTKSEYYAEILKETNGSRDEISAIYRDAEIYHMRTMDLANALRRQFPENGIYVRYISAIGINYGTALARNGKGKEGIPLIERACDEFRDTVRIDPKNFEAKRDEAECLQYLAFAHDAANNYASAIKTNEESLRLLDDITRNDPKNFEFLSQAHLTYNNSGDILYRRGQTAEALRYYKTGLEFVERLSNLDNVIPIDLLRIDSDRKIGEAYLSLGKNNRTQETLANARSHLTSARELLIKLKNNNQLGKNNEYKLNLVESSLNQLINSEIN